uniref:Uncharacterized protein n=1 Tax=Timema tahoe TaxID=61484 RepID=A0A7R9NWG8_9NEOP|nr:unnamed protein product [Timema tahoe]
MMVMLKIILKEKGSPQNLNKYTFLKFIIHLQRKLEGFANLSSKKFHVLSPHERCAAVVMAVTPPTPLTPSILHRFQSVLTFHRNPPRFPPTLNSFNFVACYSTKDELSPLYSPRSNADF